MKSDNLRLREGLEAGSQQQLATAIGTPPGSLKPGTAARDLRSLGESSDVNVYGEVAAGYTDRLREGDDYKWSMRGASASDGLNPQPSTGRPPLVHVALSLSPFVSWSATARSLTRVQIKRTRIKGEGESNVTKRGCAIMCIKLDEKGPTARP